MDDHRAECVDWLAAVREAVDNGRAGCSCSESVALAFGPRLGLERGAALGLASGLAGGMCLLGEVCGVVGAAVVVLGLRLGPAAVDDGAARRRVMLAGDEFARCFRAEHGSLLCRELSRGADLRSPEGARALRQSGRPGRLIASGAALLAEMLGREQA